MNELSYVPIHMHSHYSLLDAVGKIGDIVDKLKANNISAAALTDHGTMSGTLAFYNACKKNGIKPILGTEIYVAKRHRSQKENRKIDGYYHLILLAMNNKGWGNLCKLISEAYNPSNMYYKPRVDRELLAKYNEGLIVTSACVGGNVSMSIMAELGLSFTDQEGTSAEIDEDAEKYMDTIKWHKNIFGDRFYLEIQNHGFPIEKPINEKIILAGKELGIKVIATSDSHYVNAKDKLAHNIILAIGTKGGINSESVKKREYPGDGYWILTPKEMYERFKEYPGTVANTNEIADRCNVELTLGDFKLPHVVDVEKEDNIFIEKVLEGLRERFGTDIPDEVMKRANMEMGVIIQMTYPSYFLIVSDYVKHMKSQGYLLGPGRGSASGSIVSYALKITDVNPLDYDLSFARFLNRGRCSIPQVSFKEYTTAQYQLDVEQS